MRMRRGAEAYLIVGSCVPIGNPSRVSDLLLQAVGTECTEGDSRSAVDAADCPEWERHCDVRDVEGKCLQSMIGMLPQKPRNDSAAHSLHHP
jgi:hypothetical protein